MMPDPFQAPSAREKSAVASAVVRMVNAGHSYGGSRWQFRHLDLEIRPGEILAVLGANGRGKSTLLKAAAGLIDLNEGRIDTTSTVGFVPQTVTGSLPYSVLEIVLMGRARQISMFSTPGPADEAIARDALDLTGMSTLADRHFNTLSGGEKQLVLIARALAGRNDVLLLDEPASALDLRNQGRVLELMRDLAITRKLALAFTTHQPNHAIAVADRVLMMVDGASPIIGPIADVMTEENLQALYGVAIRLVTYAHDGREQVSAVPVFKTKAD